MEAGREPPKGQCAMSGDQEWTEWRLEGNRQPPSKGPSVRVSVEIGNGAMEAGAKGTAQAR